MRIAFIEEDHNFQEILKELVKNYVNEWKIDYYTEVAELNVTCYDVIIANISDKRLIKHISMNKAEFAIMSDDIKTFVDEELLEDSNICALIDKNDLDDLLEWLEYFDAKIKINQTIENEIKKISEFTVNGYTFQIQKNIAIVEFQENILTQENRDQLVKDLEKTNYKCVLSFKNSSHVTSILLGQIIYFWNVVKQYKGKLVIASIDNRLINAFNACSLNRLITIFNTIDDAINCVQESQVTVH